MQQKNLANLPRTCYEDNISFYKHYHTEENNWLNSGLFPLEIQNFKDDV